MKIAEFSVKNSLFVNLLSFVVVVAGVVTYASMRKEAFPPVAYDMATVSTYFRGASPEDVERLVTIPLEKELKDVDDIEEIISLSNEGISTIMLQYSDDASDKDELFRDIQKAIDRVTDLPAEVDDRPLVYDVEMDHVPVIQVSISGDMDEFTLRERSEELKDIFEEIDGVGSVNRSGFRDEEYRIEPDLDKLKEYHVSLSELTQALGAQNVNIPGGKQEYGDREYIVKIDAEFRTIQDVENTIIRSNDLGKWLKVSDIAKVVRALEDETMMIKAMGTRAINFTIVKKSKGDIIKVVDGVYKEIEKYKKIAPAELKIKTFYDMSYYVKRRLKVLRTNGSIGFILVCLILFMFLPPVSALVTAMGIPISFFMTFCVMSYMGLTVNLLTMFGLVMVLGIIVDDGIIISENTFRHIEAGMPPRLAAIKGTNEVAAPVIATILTTVVAFLPLMYMSGILGKFVRYIPMVVIIALFASLIEALVILPSHLSDFAKPIKAGSVHHVIFDKFREKYLNVLRYCLSRRYKVIAITIVLFLSSLFGAYKLGFELFGADGIEFFSAQCQFKTGMTLERVDELTKDVEDLIGGLDDQYLKAYVTTIGGMPDVRGDDPTKDKHGSNYSQVQVYLTAANERDMTAHQIVDMLREKSKVIFEKHKSEGLERILYDIPKDGPPVGADVEVAVKGEKISVILEIIDIIKNKLAEVPAVRDIDDSYQVGSSEIVISVNEDKARANYLTNSQIALTVRTALAGSVSTTIKPRVAEEEIRVMVRLPKEQRDDPLVFDKLLVENSRGQLVQLSKVITISKGKGMRSIKHLDGKRSISVTAGVDKTKSSTMKVNAQLKKTLKFIEDQYPTYSLTFEGEDKENMKSMRSLMVAFGIATLLIFVILATLFRSLIQPFIVMAPIPFALIGVVIAFFLHGRVLSFLAILGYIGLEGVVVNDSIVLVDFINKHVKNRSLFDAVVEAGKTRLRPVLITTVTTCCGLATVAYGIGGSDPILKPMALAMCWGLFFATFLTLLVIPCLYMVVDDLHRKFAGKSMAEDEAVI